MRICMAAVFNNTPLLCGVGDKRFYKKSPFQSYNSSVQPLLRKGDFMANKANDLAYWYGAMGMECRVNVPIAQRGSQRLETLASSAGL